MAFMHDMKDVNYVRWCKDSFNNEWKRGTIYKVISSKAHSVTLVNDKGSKVEICYAELWHEAGYWQVIYSANLVSWRVVSTPNSTISNRNSICATMGNIYSATSSNGDWFIADNGKPMSTQYFENTCVWEKVDNNYEPLINFLPTAKKLEISVSWDDYICLTDASRIEFTDINGNEIFNFYSNQLNKPKEENKMLNIETGQTVINKRPISDFSKDNIISYIREEKKLIADLQELDASSECLDKDINQHESNIKELAKVLDKYFVGDE